MAIKSAEYRSLRPDQRKLYRDRRDTRAAGAAASKAEKLGVPLSRLIYARTLPEIESLCTELGVDLTQYVPRGVQDKGDGAQRFGEVVGYVNYIPKESNSVLVTYDDKAGGSGRGRSAVGEIRVSAFIPAGTQKASFRYSRSQMDREFLVERPEIMMSQTFGASRTLRMSGSRYSDIKIMEVVSADSRIMVRPYRLANVYNDGKICTGGGNDRPKSLRSAWNVFWHAPFNLDLSDYDVRVCRRGDPTSDCAGVVHQRPRRCKVRAHQAEDHFSREHDHRHVTVCRCGDFAARDVSGHPDWMCQICGGLNPALITVRQAQIGRVCVCCTIEHPTCCPCACDCCSGTCRCRCACDTAGKYVEAMKNYRSKVPGEDWTKSLTAPKFFSATGSYDGVFVSSKKQILGLVDSRLHRTAFNRMVVFGLFKVLDGDRIAVQFGKDTVEVLSRDEVATFSENNNSGRSAEVR